MYWFDGSSRMHRGEDPEPKGTLFEFAPDESDVNLLVVGSIKNALTELASLVAVKFGPEFAR
jgi:hypothetical protein